MKYINCFCTLLLTFITTIIHTSTSEQFSLKKLKPEILEIVLNQELYNHKTSKKNYYLLPDTKYYLQKIFNTNPDILASTNPDLAISEEQLKCAHEVIKNPESIEQKQLIINWLQETDSERKKTFANNLQLESPLPSTIIHDTYESDTDNHSDDLTVIETLRGADSYQNQTDSDRTFLTAGGAAQTATQQIKPNEEAASMVSSTSTKEDEQPTKQIQQGWFSWLSFWI